MPLPLILGGVAAVSVAGGTGTLIHGATKMKKANETKKSADNRHKENVERFDKTSEETQKIMDDLGTLELEILHGFDDFSNIIEKIQNRPQFKEYSKAGVRLPEYDPQVLENVSIGAGILIGGLGGAALGTAGGFAAAGATTSAVMALETASTGTAIASLSGAAATNATFAALGGGAIAAGGGGIALGTTILGATMFSMGLLVGGLIFNAIGCKVEEKADEAWSEMKEVEEKIDIICAYLNELKLAASKNKDSITEVKNKYDELFEYVSYIVDYRNKTDWNSFKENERIAIQNVILLVGLLYKMCQVSLVKQSQDENEINSVNQSEIDKSVMNADNILAEI